MSYSYDFFFCCLGFQSCLECCTLCCKVEEQEEYKRLQEEYKNNVKKEEKKENNLPVHYILSDDEIGNNLSN